FPAEVSVGCSWDAALAEEIGAAIAREALAQGVGILLAPGANLKRTPLGGRNFEYFSEDPLLTGKLAAAFIRGAEQTGAGTSLKHFACNNQEYKRFVSDSQVDARSLRELYLAGFETAVTEGRPASVMCAYNKINGTHCSDNHWLLDEVLRQDWGFQGAVITDWGALHDRARAFAAGCDMAMSGGSAFMEKAAARAAASGDLAAQAVDRSAGRVLKLVLRSDQATKKPTPIERTRHHELARRAAQERAVLLKNDDSLLPLEHPGDVVLIGHLAREPRFQGAGSSRVNPWKKTSVAGSCPGVPFAPGYQPDGSTTDELLAEAARVAAQVRVAVVIAGLPDLWESEGFDRTDLALPEGQVRLIETVVRANPNTVVVLLAGGVLEIPWADQVRTILYLGLPGQAGGEAIAALLFGRAVPGGKLAESWPLRYADCVCSAYAGTRDPQYREGLYVGYRYYASAGVPVRYPFGHGLSYTSFAYRDLQLDGQRLTFRLTNTGQVRAKEVAQVYVSPPDGGPYRPRLELKAFAVAWLDPGQSRVLEIELPERSLAVWQNGWVVPGGRYTVLVGTSSENLALAATQDIKGPPLSAPADLPAWYRRPGGTPTQADWEALSGQQVAEDAPANGALTMENSLLEMKDQSWLMGLMYRLVRFVVARQTGGRKRDADPQARLARLAALDAPLRVMKINGGIKSAFLESLLAIANRCYVKKPAS
ncbi:MAG: glycosyl hydrolase, partial [Clostridiaceae bacterium]|nr:glycosyl hydrolase [Clostridiaceae bacterium]